MEIYKITEVIPRSSFRGHSIHRALSVNCGKMAKHFRYRVGLKSQTATIHKIVFPREKLKDTSKKVVKMYHKILDQEKGDRAVYSVITYTKRGENIP